MIDHKRGIKLKEINGDLDNISGIEMAFVQHLLKLTTVNSTSKKLVYLAEERNNSLVNYEYYYKLDLEDGVISHSNIACHSLCKEFGISDKLYHRTLKSVLDKYTTIKVKKVDYWG